MLMNERKIKSYMMQLPNGSYTGTQEGTTTENKGTLSAIEKNL